MTSLLMLDVDPRLVSAVTRALAEEGVTVVGTGSVEDALAALKQQSFAAALLDGDLLDAEQLTTFASLPIILSTSFLEPLGGHRSARQGGLLRKPFTSAQLLAALHDVCGSQGSMPPGLVDALRRAHSQGRSLALDVGGACVFMEQGEIVHAEYGALVGERALAEVLARSTSTPVPVAEREGVRTIHRPFQELMLDALQRLEERERGGPTSAGAGEPTPSDRGSRS